MLLFYDSEFTGLRAGSSLISIAFLAEDGRSFYAEFCDYNRSQVDDWIQQNVLAHCRWLSDSSQAPFSRIEGELTECFGDSDFVRQQLSEWLKPYHQAQVLADCHAYDWVLLCELFGGALQMPQALFYMPLDLVTLFHLKGIDPDTDRLQYSGLDSLARHNALDDARIARACYHKLMALPDRG